MRFLYKNTATLANTIPLLPLFVRSVIVYILRLINRPDAEHSAQKIAYTIEIRRILMPTIKAGDTMPAFTLPNQHGEPISSQTLLGKGPLVVYFYPKDDTPGCTREACSFRDHYEAFTDAGATVIGISADSPATHKHFAEKHGLPFVLLSDGKNTVSKAFGVPNSMLGLLPGRVTYVMDSTGMVHHVFNSQLNPTKHVTESLRIIADLSESNTPA